MMNLLHDCLQCGGDLQIDARTGILTCAYCGRQYRDDSQNVSHDIQEIVSRRQVREFIQAEELCRNLIANQPDNAEAYWQKLLCELGVVYVHENGVAKPTFFSYSYDSRLKIMDNPDYKRAIDNAKTNEDKEYYKNQAVHLDILLKEFFELVAKESSYDIFISFKKTTQAIVDGESTTIDTDDYYKAREIYNSLKDKYKVFFSPVSIGGDTGIYGEKYEPRILKALQTAQAMILVGSKRDYIESNWVENEWRRYQYFIKKGLKKKNSLILGYVKNMPVLPSALREIQLPSFDMFSADYLNNLSEQLSFVKSSKGLKSTLNSRKLRTDFLEEKGENIFKGSAVQRVSLQDRKDSGFIQIEASEAREIASADSMRTNGSFNDAIMLYSQILRKNSNNARAYFGRFLCKIKAKEGADIIKCANYITAEALKDLQNAVELAPTQKEAYGYISYLHKVFEVKEKAAYSHVETELLSNVDKTIVNSAIDKANTKKTLEPVCWASLEKKSLIFDFVNKYVDAPTARYLITNFQGLQKFAVEKGDLKTASRIYEWAKSIFFEENHKLNVSFVYEWAKLLFEYKHYALALDYFEDLAYSTQASGECYYYILCCRLKTNVPEQSNWSFRVDTSDDMTVKTPEELDIDEIIERIFICDNGQKTTAVNNVITIAKEQAARGYAKAKKLIEIIINCFQGLDKDDFADEFIREIAKTYIFAGKYNSARTYLNELIARNEKDAQAHWLLLKCKLKVSTDNQLSNKRSKLFKTQEFNNALNCASDSEYKHFMDVYNGKVKTSTITEKGKSEFNRNANYKKDIRFIRIFYICIFAISLFSLLFQGVFYTYVHFGWVIAGISVLFVLTCGLLMGLSKWRGYSKVSGFMFLLMALTMASSITSMCVVPSKPIELTSEKQFDFINNFSKADECDFVLTRDMDFEGQNCAWYNSIDEYHGTFDGCGYSLNNINITCKSSKSKIDNPRHTFMGLVKKNKGIIKNLNFNNCELMFTIEVGDDVHYYDTKAYFGTVCGRNEGTITDCNVNNTYMTLRNEMIQYDHIFISGIAGSNIKTITNCSYICDNTNEDYQYSITFLAVRGLGVSASSTKYYIRGIAYSGTESVIENCNDEYTSGKVEKTEKP